MYHLRKLKTLLLLLFVAVTVKAQLEDGKVYNFVNIANTGKSMVWVSGDQLSIADTDESDYRQLWYVVKNEDNSYSLRNLDNGKYLRSPNATGNERWTTVETADDNCKFECVGAGNGYSLRATNSTGGEHEKHYMHYSSANGGVDRIVCWSTTAPSQWTINEVAVSEKDLEYMFAIGDKAIYQEALSNLFTDNSCSELNSDYASYTEDEMKNDENYQKLSKVLQDMVLKVLSGNWEEANFDENKESWSTHYAKKYRVQLYEPYNEPECAAAALGLNAHTNLNNPTGIFANEREVIYVMVEGEIKSGASLYLASYTGNGRLGGYNSGIELSKGLNVIPSNGTGNNYCINYVVHTFDTEGGTKKGNQAKKRKLSEYSDLKIHIEGGYINGYWNKVGDELYAADTNESWEYIEDRATQTTVTVLGEYITLQFPLLDEHTVDTDGNTNKGLKSFFNELVNVEDVIDEWDNVMMWERFLLGVAPKEVTTSEKNVKSPYSESDHVVEYTGEDGDAFAADYGDYYNLHGLSFGIPNSYMYGTWDHCGYNFNTMGSIIGEICTSAGSHWGPGHEIGHQHQGIFNMRGLTEVTNNLFSNVVLWYFGETTSRVNGTEGSLSNVLAAYNAEGSDFFTNNIWAQTHMYYKMFLYYHVLGHNPKFYPRLFEMLRQDPMNIRYEQSGAESLLHFYKKCCYASGEDLTEFFRAYGFFRVMTDRFVGDYSNAVYNQTQAEIDAAIAEVKAWAEANEAKENVALLFINDATGETIKSHKGDNLDLYGESVVCSEMGGYATFEQSITEGAELEFTMSGQNVTVSAGGGVGYAIYNKDGEIIAFSDKKTFAISDECATALMWGEATMKVINADNTTTEVEVADEVATKYALLGGLIEEVNTNVLQYVDETNKTVGYYISGELSELKQVLEEAQEVYDNQTVDSYTAMYAKLSQVYSEVTHNDYNRIAMVLGVYRLKNRNHSDRWMSVNDSKAAVGESGDESSAKQQWTFESAGEEGLYYIKNVHTQLYLGSLVKNNQISANAAKADAKGYRLTAKGTGIWLVTCQDDNRMSLNWNGNSGKVLGWDGEGEAATQWTLTAVSVDGDAKKLQELSALVKKTKELIGEMAEVTPMQKQTLQTTSSSSPFYLSTNACHNTLNGASDGQGLAGLLDEDAATYFHSDYNGKVSGTHYLQVDMGASNLSDLAFYYTTRDNGNNCPTTIEVWGSTDGTTFDSKLYTFTGLPTDGAKTWESPMLSKAKDYSSLRFMVTTAEGGNKFFVMSRFGFAKCEATVQSKGEEYVAQGLTDDALISAYTSIHSAQEKIMVGGATLEDLTSLYDELSSKYNNLLTIYENAENAAFTAKQTELQAWITTLNGFFGDSECGTVTPIDATSFTLSTTNSNDAYYLTGGPDAASEGDISNLLEDNVTSYYVSNWNAQTEAPYLQVRLPEGKTLSEFTFTFTSRDGGKAPTPTEIVVSGSNDGAIFTPIDTLTKENDGFPEAANTDNKNAGKAVTWLSPTITASKAYQYLRFTVTKSHRPTGRETDSNGFYHYSISKFGLGTPSGYSITLGAKAGGVTKKLLLESYNVVATADATLTMATTEEQLQKAIDKLKEQKTALEQAQQIAVEYSVVVVGGNGQGGVVYGGTNRFNGVTFSAPTTLGIKDLEAIPLTGYTDGVITMNGTTITVTYDKIYNVQVVGVEPANGGVKLGETTYAGGATFNMLESSFDINNFTAIPVEGYAPYKTFDGTTITVTYKKVYAVNVVGVADQGGVVFESNDYTHGQELHALNLEFGSLTAMPLTGYVANVALEGTTITVTYNKTYTVQVVGLDGQGGVQFGDGSYNHGQELNALNLQVGNLTAIVPEGYVADVSLEGATITVTYKKVYTVQVTGGEGDRGVIFEGNTYTNNAEVHVLGTLNANQLEALPMDGYAPYVSVEDATIHVTYKMIYRVAVVGGDGNGGVTFEENTYANNAEVHALSSIELNQLTAVDGSDYVGTITLDGRTITVTYCKLVKDLSELRNYKAYHIRARSGEGYFAYNSLVTGDYVSLRGMTNWSYNNLPSNADVANKYKEAVSLSDKTVAWQIIKEGDKYYLYQPEKNAYVTRDGRNYKFIADSTALDGIRQNGGADAGTFGIHAGGGYSDGSTNFACIVTNEASMAVRNWTWGDHGAVLQIIENPYVYALDYAVKVVGGNGGVEFENNTYANNSTLSATELLTEHDLTILSIDGYESAMEISRENATITVTYTAIDKTELINLITETKTLVDGCYTDEVFNYTSSLNVTEALIEETNEVLATAIEVRDNSSANREEYEAALTALQAAKSKLSTAIDYVNLPVQLTFNADSPVTYKVTINRSGLPVLAYDESTTKVAVTEFKAGNKSQGWYFMAADDGKVYIMPYHGLNTTHALSTNSFSAGAEKVQSMPIGEGEYTQEWIITNVKMNEDNRKDGWYNITTINPDDINTIWYFSHHGGGTNKMGFYNYPNDPGSLFKFEQADFSKSEAYYTLYNYYHGDAKVKSSDFEGNDEMVGYYPIAETEAYKTAYSNAASVLESLTSTPEEYTNAYNALKAANEALVINMPEVGKYYTIASACRDHRSGQLMYATSENAMVFSREMTSVKPEALWTFTSDGYLENLQTGCSVSTASTGGAKHKLGESPKKMDIKSISVDGQVLLTPNGGQPLHAQDNGSVVVGWGSYDAGSASAWRIVEVEEMSLVNFALKIGQYRHAGLYLNYAAKIPENVKVYIAHTPDGADGSIIAEELEGTILPARTAVIVKGDAATYNFKYTSEDYDGNDDLSVNLLGGSAYLKYQQVEAEGNLCCAFGQKSGVVGLYKNYVEYTDASGSQIDSESKENVADTDNGTHFKVSANKIYYEYKPSAVAGASAFRVRFNSKEEGTTTIDELLMLDETIIYNLYGQRIAKVVEAGIYIVNGKKIFVTEKMIGNNN